MSYVTMKDLAGILLCDFDKLFYELMLVPGIT